VIPRTLTGLLAKSKKSVLLLGPRQTGKSTLIRGLSPDLSINLARESTYLSFASNPRELEQQLAGGAFKTVFIDEVQRLPSVLNTIQAILDEAPGPIKFYLTGSSARKLRRGEANLLPGRVHTYHLGALVAGELNYAMDTKQALTTGTLPGLWTTEGSQERQKTLRTYAATYLKEEIQAEALSRNIEGFSRFLFVLAAHSGQFLDLAKLASEAAIPRQTAVRYFEVLEDTLILRRCDSFSKSTRRRLIQSPRFFFFDTGVLNGLLDNFSVSADRIGMLFEHLVFNQLVDSAASKDMPMRIASYRTEHGAEVDFILELNQEVIAVEVKASQNIGPFDTRGMRSFAEYYRKPHRSYIAYLGSTRKKLQDVSVVPWQMLLKEMGL
jgi:predicted AAA+ superfamily ATPase